MGLPCGGEITLENDGKCITLALSCFTVWKNSVLEAVVR